MESSLDGTPPDRFDLMNLSLDRYWDNRKDNICPRYKIDASSNIRAKRSLKGSHGPLVSRDPLPFPPCYLALERMTSSLIFELGSRLLLAFLPCPGKVVSPSVKTMDSGGSSSDSRPSVEERMEALESALGRLRGRADR